MKELHLGMGGTNKGIVVVMNAKRKLLLAIYISFFCTCKLI